tara:strand:- start:5585 stop:6355 length:771 start_codon:yes stop_codon:yes gene_type:complete
MDIQALASLKILLVGDSCTDIYINGVVERLSPEAPIPVLKYSSSNNTQGMAANVFINLDKFGCEITFLTQDEVIKKTRYVDVSRKYQLLRVDEEPIASPLRLEILDVFDDIFDAVVISDYNKGFINEEVVKKIKENFSAPIIVDSKRKDLSCYSNCMLKINDSEYRSCELPQDLSALIVTKGPEGAIYDGKLYPVNVVEVHDVSGAGDTFLAAFSVLIAADSSIEDAIQFANYCASKVVQRFGTSSVTEKEILSYE